MYDLGFSASQHPENCSSMQSFRYVPGSKFESGWDLLVEEFEYDAEGRVTLWRKFQQVRGNVIWETEYSYDDKGEISQERILRPGEKAKIKRNFSYVYDDQGAFVSGEVRLGTGELVGKILAGEGKGIRKYIESPEVEARSVTYIYDESGKILGQESVNGGYEYAYDKFGELIVQRQKVGATTHEISYEMTRDAQDRIVTQTEINSSERRLMAFDWTTPGELRIKRMGASRPTEMRHYYPDGSIKDVLYYDSRGFPKEVLHFHYRFHNEGK